jgi:hypothetical protein
MNGPDAAKPDSRQFSILNGVSVLNVYSSSFRHEHEKSAAEEETPRRFHAKAKVISSSHSALARQLISLFPTRGA